MDRFFLEATLKTPRIDFDYSSGKLEISGRSIPENSVTFYEPILEKLKKVKDTESDKIELHVKLEYFNTSSSKSLITMFRTVESMQENKEVIIYWYYDIEDEDMMESGEDFKNILKVPFLLERMA